METMSNLSRSGPLLMPPPMAKVPRPKSADGSHTKPMRSSPLAGPALNRSPPTFTTSMSGKQESLTITTPPICYVLPPKSCESLDALTDPNPSTFRRKSATTGSKRAQSMYSESGHVPRTAAAEWEIDPLQSLSISRTPLRPRTSSGIPSFRLPIPTVEEEPDWLAEDADSRNTSRNSSTSEIAFSGSSSQPQVNSWYTTNPYDVTPRFSRLGLSASTVVMPLSPKEHRRLSRNNSVARSDSTTSTSTATAPKRFFIPSLSSKSPPATPTRVSLQPIQPHRPQTSPQQQSKSLSRTLSTASSSESSSIASNSQSETPTPISSSTSAPSLTRSKSSEDSISTCYESLPPTTPHLERDITLPAENDGEGGGRDKEEVDGGIGGVGKFHSLERDRDHAQFHYSDITITIKNNSDDDATRLDPRPQPQPTPTLSPPTHQSTTNSLFPPPAFPKDAKKERVSLRKKLVRIKLQPLHDVDDLEDSVLALNFMKSMIMPMTPPTKATEVGKVVPELPAPLALPMTVSTPMAIVKSADTLLSASSISLPAPTTKKKRSTFRSVWRNFMAKW